ncbi:M48 family metalloprotease [Streptomyces sp. NPDC018007]|uniref:M48 family metalloprotease n=1 Tax=Streptomyces sp. NPDC018007 TaxID=3365029 RepID=UPI00379927AC
MPEHPPEPSPLGARHPEFDDLDYRHSPGNRVYLSARQRRVDATALGRLALYLPNFLLSLASVALAAWLLELAWGLPLCIPMFVWLVSGALVFHRPTENLFARRVLRLRYPLPGEFSRLQPIWREVTGRAGVEGRRYRLWIEDSDELNAYAAAGHIVGVTRYAVEQLPSAQLAAVLAHELGHHTGGHSWSGLLGYWYALPGRVVCRVGRRLLVGALVAVRRRSCIVPLVLIAGLTIMVFGSATVLLALPFPLLALPYAMAALNRRAELRADRHAASLGFAPMLMEALQAGENSERPLPCPSAQGVYGRRRGRRRPLTHLLDSHPDLATRLHHLRRYTEPPR